jgi:hypothetical protein
MMYKDKARSTRYMVTVAGGQKPSGNARTHPLVMSDHKLLDGHHHRRGRLDWRNG